MNAFLLAALTLGGVPGDPVPPVTLLQWDRWQPTLSNLAADAGVLDPSESTYILTSYTRLSEDVDRLRERIQESQEWPQVSEGAWLPDAQTAYGLSSFHSSRRERCLILGGFYRDHKEYYFALADRSEALSDFWIQVWLARGERISYYRRAALEQVRQILGPTDWRDHNVDAYFD